MFDTSGLGDDGVGLDVRIVPRRHRLYGVIGFMSVRFALAAVLAPYAACKVARRTLVAVLLSLLGIVLLAGGGPDGANRGDILTRLCAGALGLHIALLSRYARERRLRACLRSDAFDGARLRAALAPLRARSFAAAGGLALPRRGGPGRVGRGVFGTDLRTTADLRGPRR